MVAGSNPVVHPTHTTPKNGVVNTRLIASGFRYNGRLRFYLARVAELVDALVLGTSVFDVGVRVSPFAPDLVPVYGTSPNPC